MAANTLSRRALLAGLGAAGALPLLEPRRLRAATAAFPTRLLVVVWPNGAFAPRFFPEADGPLVLDPKATTGPASTLAPLAPFARKLLVVGGLDLKPQVDSGSNNGHQAAPFVLTGKPGAPFEGTWDGFKKTAGGPSVDQHVAQQLRARGVATKFPSLVLRTSYYKGNDGYVSIAGPPVGNKVNAPIPEHSPAKLFETLFGDLAGGWDEAEAARRRASGKSVLDYVARNVERVGRRLGTEDKQRLDAHLTGLREIERQLATTSTGACTAPPAIAPSTAKTMTTADTLRSMGQMADLTVAAFRCDLTRVVSLNWNGPFNFAFPTAGGIALEDGASAGPFFDEHGIAHKQHNSPEGAERRALVDRWFCEQFGALLGKLEAVKEGDGTMLDHTVVLFANQMGDGWWHTVSDLPWIVAGGGNRTLKMGRVIRHPSGDKKKRLPQVRLLRGLCAALDVPADGFADPAYGDELAGLRG